MIKTICKNICNNVFLILYSRVITPPPLQKKSLKSPFPQKKKKKNRAWNKENEL